MRDPVVHPALCKSNRKRKNSTSIDRESYMDGGDEVAEVEKVNHEEKDIVVRNK